MPEGDIHIHQEAHDSENVTMIGYMVQEVKRERACPTAPPPPPHFAGRVEQLEILRQRLATGQQTAITAVQGLGGMGKTTLAKAFAQLATRELGYSAVLWADITRSPNALRWLESWAQYADPAFSLANVPPEMPPEALAGRVRSLLTALIAEQCPGRTLVVLDDVWPGDGITAARLLIQAAPEGSTLFITTRSEEAARKLKCTMLGVPRLPEPEAIELLGKLVDNKAATPEHFTALATLLGGHPLALELAAGSVNLCEGAGEIADLLAGYKKGLKEGVPFHKLELGDEAGAKEDSLIVTFQHSYDALDPDLQRRFRAMGIFPPDTPWDVILAAFVWGEAQEGRSDEEMESPVKQAIKSLRVRGLLAPTRLEGYPEGWYEPHPLLRSYARALLNKVGESDEVRSRNEQAVIAITNWGFHQPKQKWRSLTPYLPHIHAVGDDLYTRIEVLLGDIELLAQPERFSEKIGLSSLPDDDHNLLNTGSTFAAAVYTYVWFRRETGKTGRRWLALGLACARALEQQDREKLLIAQMGSWHNRRGQKGLALSYMLQGLALYSEASDRHGEAAILNNIGELYDSLGDRQQALRHYNRALPITREIGDRTGEAAIFNNIGSVYASLGDRQQALRHYNRALPITREIGDRFGEATILNNIAAAYNALGDRQQALHYFAEALFIRREVGDRTGEAATLNRIGEFYYALGHRQRALHHFNEALPITREVGDRTGEATSLHNIGRACNALGDRQQALRCYEEALSIRRKEGDRTGEAATLDNIGMVYNALGDRQQALYYYSQALPITREVRDRSGEATILGNIAEVYRILGDQQQALSYFNEALTIQQEIGDRPGKATTLNNLGLVYYALGDRMQAIHYFNEALPVLREVGYHHGEAGALFNMSFLLTDDEAIPLVEQARDIWAAIGSPELRLAEARLAELRGRPPEDDDA